MAFKAKKLNIDLDLDLTEYIPGADGNVKAVKTSPAELNEYLKISLKNADKLMELQSASAKNAEIGELSEALIIEQIDYLYEKGSDFWSVLPHSVRNKLVQYIGEEVSGVKKN